MFRAGKKINDIKHNIKSTDTIFKIMTNPVSYKEVSGLPDEDKHQVLYGPEQEE